MRICSTENCNNEVFTKEVCRKCYDKQKYQYVPKDVATGKRSTRTPNDYIIEGNICKIGCYNNKSELTGYAIIDVEDIEKCKPYKWRLLSRYVTGSCGSKNPSVLLHYLVLNLKPEKTVSYIDHRDGNTWNNRKKNLRLCNNSENLCNRGKASNNVSGYKGVYASKHRRKWEAEIGKDNAKYHLGFFDDIVEAAKAYDKKALELHGKFAYQNFPKSTLKRRNPIQ